MITDHNVNCKELPKVDGLILIYGAELSKKGRFICAHVVFEPGFIYSKIHDIAIASRIPEQKGMDLPPLIFAQSGAIYFEK